MDEEEENNRGVCVKEKVRWDVGTPEQLKGKKVEYSVEVLAVTIHTFIVVDKLFF